MSLPDPTALERLRYEQGQQLRSRDRRDQVAIEAQLRWWHNRAVHNAFGVAEGLAVEKQDDSIVVRPGLAYDCRGRELILQQRRTVPPPPASDDDAVTTFLLVVRYKESGEYPPRGELSGVCVPGGRVGMLFESPDFEWVAEKSWMPARGVPLASATVDDGELKLGASFVRPRARARAMPRIATGSTLPGATAWQAWRTTEGQGNDDPVHLGFEVLIDTTSAGFTETPCYFAWLRGSLWNQRKVVFIAAPLQHVTDTSRHGFTFRVMLPEMFVENADFDGASPPLANSERGNNWEAFPEFAVRKKLYVYWIGIQETPDLTAAYDGGGMSHGHS